MDEWSAGEDLVRDGGFDCATVYASTAEQAVLAYAKLGGVGLSPGHVYWAAKEGEDRHMFIAGVHNRPLISVGRAGWWPVQSQHWATFEILAAGAARLARLTAVVEAVAWAIGKDLVEDCEPLATAIDALEESDVDPVAAPTVAAYFAMRREEEGR